MVAHQWVGFVFPSGSERTCKMLDCLCCAGSCIPASRSNKPQNGGEGRGGIQCDSDLSCEDSPLVSYSIDCSDSIFRFFCELGPCQKIIPLLAGTFYLSTRNDHVEMVFDEINRLSQFSSQATCFC